MAARACKLFLVCCSALAAGGVAPLTASNFSAVTADPQALWLVKFYAPWCGHCKRLAPVLDEVASAVPDVKFGKVDATIETALRDQYTVKGYPTLLVMRGGKTWEHRGQRSKSGLMSLLERMQGPAVREVADPADLRAAIKPVLFLLGRDHDAAEPAHAVFEAVASSRQHADDFAAAEADEVLDAVGLAATPRPFVAKLEPGESADVLSSVKLRDMDEAALEAWVMQNRLRVFSIVDAGNFYELAQNPSRPLALLLVDPCEGTPCDDSLGADASTRGMGAELLKLSRDSELRGSFYFGLLDGRKWQEFAADHHVGMEEMPRLLVLQAGRTRSFFVDDGAADLGGFLRRVHAGELSAEYEGMWGMPDRWWRVAVRWVPTLLQLNFLPRWALAGPLLVVAVLAVGGLLVWLLLWEPSAPHQKDE